MGAEQRAPRYSAFISYSHEDVAYARRLHRRLEAYRLPRRLVRNPEARGPGSRRLKPIFRDRDELRAASDLTEAVRAAIADSSHLIVVCSPNAAVSTWVGKEIAFFRSLRGDKGILAALIAGAPAEAFPPELLHPAAEGPALQPLAADFREHKDGQRLALLKLVAALADVGLDELVQRDAQRHIRQITAVTIASLIGMAITGSLAVVAVQARKAAERERARGEGVIEFMLTDLRSRLKSVGRLDVLDAVNRGAVDFYRGQDLNHLPPKALLQRAKLLQDIGQDDVTRGNLPAARAQFDEAKRTTATLLAAKPHDPERVYAHAQSEYWVGFLCWRSGDDDGAERGFKAYAALARRLVELDPKNLDFVMETGYADSNLGSFLLHRSVDTAHAEPLFRAAQADFETVARQRPNDQDLQIQVADGYAWLAEVDRLRGNYDGAIAWREKQKRVLLAVLARDPRDFETRRHLLGNELGLARLALARGDFDSAIAQLRKDHSDAVALARIDPENADVAKQVRVMELFEVATWLSMPLRARPAPTLLAATLGSCSAERREPNNEELTGFCIALLSKYKKQYVAPDQFLRNNQPDLAHYTDRGDTLTERWLLDNVKDIGR